jgi:hypothetical protein
MIFRDFSTLCMNLTWALLVVYVFCPKTTTIGQLASLILKAEQYTLYDQTPQILSDVVKGLNS